jgi:hypothetical protein
LDYFCAKNHILSIKKFNIYKNSIYFFIFFISM